MGIMETIKWLLLGDGGKEMELTKGMLDNMVVSRIVFKKGWIENDKVDIVVVLAFANSSEEVADVRVSITNYDDAIGSVFSKDGFKISEEFRRHATSRVKALVKPISKKYEEVYYGPNSLIQRRSL